MLPPPTSHDRPSGSHIRTSSYRLTSHHERQRSSTSHVSGRGSEDEEEADLRRELEMELEEEGGNTGDERERGLEETLERIGMG